MPQYRLHVNGVSREANVDSDTPLLWVLRDHFELTGTKYGCGVGVCGSCTILEGSEAVRACQVPIAAAAGRRFTTIEGLSKDGSHPCQRAWLEEDVAQCGYCQPAMIMTACALLAAKKKPNDRDINEAYDDMVCRCGSYPRIRKAVHRAAELGGAK